MGLSSNSLHALQCVIFSNYNTEWTELSQQTNRRTVQMIKHDIVSSCIIYTSHTSTLNACEKGHCVSDKMLLYII